MSKIVTVCLTHANPYLLMQEFSPLLICLFRAFPQSGWLCKMAEGRALSWPGRLAPAPAPRPHPLLRVQQAVRQPPLSGRLTALYNASLSLEAVQGFIPHACVYRPELTLLNACI